MAYLHRLMFAALVLLTSGLPSTSFASFPATDTTPPGSCTVAPCLEYSAQNYTDNSVNPSGWRSTIAAACEVYRARLDAAYATSPAYVPFVFQGPTAGNTGCSFRSAGSQIFRNASLYSRTASPVTPSYSCPSNSTLSGSTCTCNSGFTQSGSSCVVPDINNCPAAGTSAGRWSHPYTTGVSDPYSICDGATPSGSPDGSLCVVVIRGDIAVGSGADRVVYGEASYTGGKSSSCDGNGGTSTTPGSGNSPTPVQGEPAPTPCKSGYAPGTVNGITSCYPAGATGKPVTTTSTGSSSTSVDGNTPTSSGTSTSVTCQLGNCTSTTSTTTIDAAGVSSTTVTTKSESEGDFCKSNPRASQCVISAWGGSCSANFTCDGDAIMCAITREQHIRNCKLFDDMSSPEAQLYDAEKGKTGEQTSALPGSTSIQVSSASFDTSDAIGAGSGCIADKSVTVVGFVVTLPFSFICGHLAMLGNILMFVSFLLAGRIFVRG